MSLLSMLRFGNRRRPAPVAARKTRTRQLRPAEKLEERRVMAADIHIGMTYFDPNDGTDTTGNTFMLHWIGGAPGTQLSRIVIDTDKDGTGLTIGDTFFHVSPSEDGAFGWFPFTIVSSDGIGSVTHTLADDNTKLILDFTGFDAGEKLVFKIDVDEVAWGGPTAVAEGKEFEGSKLIATFTAPRHFDVTEEVRFWDDFDMSGLGLDLPGNDYSPPLPSPSPVYTAGAQMVISQPVIPSRLEGVVFEDYNANNQRDPGDHGIANVTLTLWKLEGSQYVSTGISTTTDAQGRYAFENVMPGQYRIVQTQPNGYLSVGATPGTVAGVVNGVVTSPDIISEIFVLGDDQGLNYDFAEVRPGELSGRVYHDVNNNGVFDGGEVGIGGVSIIVQSVSDPAWSTTVLTAADGTWSAGGLMPGQYTITEVRPAGWLDGAVAAGTAGGVANQLDRMVTGVLMVSGQVGEEYNFGHLLPSSISGRIHADRNGDCIWDPDEPLVAGASVFLLDANGIRIAQTTTDAQGRYSFEMLPPGEYGVEVELPSGYFEKASHPGSEGGAKDGPLSIISIVVGSGTEGTDYNFCVVEPAAMSGYVYVDANQNGVRDPGEAPIPGVTIQLLDASGNFTGQTAVTDAGGFYSFVDLKPGTYGVKQIQPAGYFNGTASAGSEGGLADSAADTITGVLLSPAVFATNYNFGELPPGTISGYVFQDGPPIVAPPGADVDVFSYRNGVRDANDKPIAGVTLYLAALDGTPILGADGQPVKAVTDANGFYQFSGLKPGEYYTIFQVQPSGYINGINTPGTTGGLVYQAGRNEWPANLVNAITDDAITRVFVYAGDASLENNFAEVLAVAPPTDPPIPPTQLVFGFVPISPPPVAPARPAFFLGAPQLAMLMPTSPPITNNQIFFGGVGTIDSFTWHLSVINGGSPRGGGGPTGTLVRRVSSRDGNFEHVPMNEGTFHLHNTSTGETRSVVFGKRFGRPVTGDFNGDGVTSVGIFYDGEWFIDLNGNGEFDDGDLWAELGSFEDLPVTGDWDGDGKTDIGIYGPSWTGDERALEREPGLPDSQNRGRGVPKNVPPQPNETTNGVRNLRKTSKGQVRADVIDHVFRHGVSGDVPLSGDWNGDGISTIGLFSDGEWWLDTDGDGKLSKADRKFTYGRAGDIPVVGDFNGDGITNVGVYRDGVWYIDLDQNHRFDSHDRAFEFGEAGDIPVVGDWDGDGRDNPGVYRPGEVATDGDAFDVTPAT